jgi:DNA polymerase III alpha subunit
VQAQDTFERVTTVRVEDLHEYPDGQEIVVGGSVGKLTPHTTRAGAPMLFFTLQTLVAEIEVTVFPRVYEQTRDLFQPDALLVVTGKLQRQETETINGERAVDLKVLCDRVRPLTEARKPSAKKLELARQGRMAQQQASSEPDSPGAAPPQPTDAHLCLRLTGPQVSAPLLERVRSLLQSSHGPVPVRLVLDDGRTFALADDFAVAVTRGLMQDMADLIGPSAAILVSSPPS